MSKLIRVVGFANGEPCPIAGQYLEAFDFDAQNGLGFGTFTSDPRRARVFRDAAEAAAFWRTPSRRKPKRWDGEPNRPLTCTTIEIVEEPTSPFAVLKQLVEDQK